MDEGLAYGKDGINYLRACTCANRSALKQLDQSCGLHRSLPKATLQEGNDSRLPLVLAKNMPAQNGTSENTLLRKKISHSLIFHNAY